MFGMPGGTEDGILLQCLATMRQNIRRSTHNSGICCVGLANDLKMF